MTGTEQKANQMIIQRIGLENLFDLDRVELSDLSPRINVIHGPNEAGKTSLLLALRMLLWPDEAPVDKHRIEASLKEGDDDWFIKLYDGTCTRQKNSTDTDEKLPVPSAQHSDRYHLALHDLLQEENEGEPFADRILQEFAGGYEIGDAFADVPEKDGSYSSAISEYDNVETADEELQAARDRIADVEAEQRQLGELEESIEEARKAEKQKRLYNDLLEYKKQKKTLRNARNEYEDFPEVLEEIAGNEDERIRQLQQEIDEYKQKARDAEETLEEAEDELDEIPYPYDEPRADLLSSLEEKVDKLSDLEDEMDDLEADLEGARERRRGCAEDLDLDPDADETVLRELDEGAYKQLEDLATTWEKLHAKVQSHESVLDLLTEKDGEEVADDKFQSALDKLTTWLAHPSPEASGTDDPGLSTPEWIALGTTGVFVVVLSVVQHPAWLIGLLVPAVLWWLLRTDRGGAATDHRRSHVEQDWEELDLPVTPGSWTEEAVRNSLRKLISARAKWVRVRKQKEKRAEHEEDLEERREDLEQVEEDVEAHVEPFGLDVPDQPEPGQMSAGSQVYRTKRLLAWKTADDDVRDLKEQLDVVRNKREDLLEELNETFEIWGLDPANTAADARSHRTELEERTEAYKDALGNRDDAKKDLKRLRKNEIPRKQERKGRMLMDVGLDPDETDRLVQLCEQKEAYQEARNAFESAQDELERKREQLEDYDAFDEDLLDLDLQEMQQSRDEYAEEADKLDERLNERGKLEQKITDAKQGYEVEPAVAKQDRALDDLEDKFHENVREMFNHELEEYLREEALQKVESDAKDRAGELFSRITNGRYRLRVEPSDPPQFRVVDTRTERGKSVEELSSGTRVQFLLAVRLAFVEEQERDVKLPLLFDETLANADDRRAEVLIDTIQTLVDDGRQVFYVTAQGDEVAKWRHRTGDGDRINEIDLTEHRDEAVEGAVKIRPSSTFEDDGPQVPDPSGYDHAEFGAELDVPPVDGTSPVGDLHLWYLIEDLEYLAELLSAGIQRWGAYRHLRDVEGVDLRNGRSRSTIDAIRERAQAMETFLELYQHGRNTPVGRYELEESGAVSGTFIDEVTALSEEVDGDPEEIVSRLWDGEVDRFYDTKKKELEEYLREQNYIDDRAPVDEGRLLQSMKMKVDDEAFSNAAEDEIRRLWTRIRQRGEVEVD